jgi:hypothetical protein
MAKDVLRCDSIVSRSCLSTHYGQPNRDFRQEFDCDRCDNVISNGY